MSNFKYIFSILFLVCVLSAIGMNAQESELSRPVVSSYRFEIGNANARSTYLSPLRYSGNSFAVSGAWEKAFQKHPDNLVMSFGAFANYKNMLNPPHSARMLGFDARFNWGMAYRQRLPQDMQFTVGGLIDLSGGALYLTRNGNNPVTVMASASFDLDCSFSKVFHIGRLPVIVSDRVKLPVIGAFFNPDFGETLYEVYIGNHSGLIHCGWWGNNFGIDNFLSVKLDFGRTALELGYRYDYRSFYSGNLVTRAALNSFTIGVIPGGLGLMKKSTINSPLY